MIQIQIPEKAKYIIETIQNAGFEAYVVGGCVAGFHSGQMPGGLGHYHLGETGAGKAAVSSHHRHRNPAWHRNRHAGQGRL